MVIMVVSIVCIVRYVSRFDTEFSLFDMNRHGESKMAMNRVYRFCIVRIAILALYHAILARRLELRKSGRPTRVRLNGKTLKFQKGGEKPAKNIKNITLIDFLVACCPFLFSPACIKVVRRAI